MAKIPGVILQAGGFLGRDSLQEEIHDYIRKVRLQATKYSKIDEKKIMYPHIKYCSLLKIYKTDYDKASLREKASKT